MSLETDLQNVISSATSLNQNVQGKINEINTTLNNAVADVDATMDAAVADASSRVSSVLAGPTAKRFSIQSMYIPEETIIVNAAKMIGNDYDKTQDVDNSIIVAENPHQHVDGFPMADPSIVKNPFQEYMAVHGTTSPSEAYSPYVDNTMRDDPTGACFVDLPMWDHGSSLRGIRYSNSNKVWGDSTVGKNAYLVLRIGVEGSPHRAHRTWVQVNARWQGAHNGRMWWERSSSDLAALNVDLPEGQMMEQRVAVNGHQPTSNIKIEHTENSGLNAAEGSVYRNQGIYLLEASGYGFGGWGGSWYGSWMAIPIFGLHQWQNIRLWNWGHGRLAISAAGIAFGDYMPDTPA